MKRILLPLLMGLFIFWACGGGDVTPENPEPTPQPEQKEPLVIPSTENLSPTFDVAGGSSTVSFTANADWVATVTNTRADAWCTVSPSSGTKGNNTITIKVASNDTPDSRSAVVQLVSGTAARNINVTQKQKDALTLTTDRFEISKEGGLVEIEVKANVQVSYSIDDKSKDWVSYVGTRALKSSIMTFKVLENGTSEKRESTITLSSGSLKETVTIYQSAGEKPSIVISKNEYNISSEGETIQVEVSSNVDVEVVMPGVEWITENTTRAMSTHTYYYTVSSNEGYDSRSAEIIFRNKANNLEEKVTVNQAQKDAIIIAGSEYYFGYERGFLDLEVAANVDYNVTIDCDWIRQITTRGLSTTTLKFDIDENTGTELRTGKITVSSGAISQNVEVIQSGKAEFSISIETVEVGPEKSEFEVIVTSNIGYKVEPAADWIKEVSVEGTGVYKHTFEVSENSSSAPREGVIVFCNDNQVCIPVVVKQRGAEAYITIEEKEYTIGSDGGDVNVEVSSNVEVEVVMPGVDWLTINEAKSRATGKYYFSVSPNESIELRSAEVIFRNEENQIGVAIRINQLGKDEFSISTDKVELGAEEGFFEFVVKSSIGYKVEPAADWINEISKTGSNGVYTHTFKVGANTSTEAREGVVVVCNDNQVCIPVVVRQAGAQTQDEEDMSWVDKEFYHRSLAMRFTADWCGYCPTVAANMAEFERLYPNKVEMVHMHCDGNLKFSGAGPLENLCNITGFPTGIFDMRGEFYSTSSIKEQLDKTEQNYSTQTGVSYKSSLSGSNLTLDLKVYAKEADKYKITVLLLEDNIVGYQADYYNGTQYDYVHSGVVRMALTNVLGDDCTTTQNNQIVKKSYSVNIPSKYKKENMRILVYVQRPYGGQSIIDGKYYGNYYVDNSISGKLGAEFKLEMIEDLSGGGNEDIIPDDDIDF